MFFVLLYSKPDLKKSDSPFLLRSDTDVYYAIEWLKFVLLIVAKPCMCAMGLITNLLTILVITNKCRRKDFSDQMYKLILLNSVFNIAYCAIMTLKLLNECLFYTSTVFCSKYYQTNASQYFKIVVVMFLGNVCKTCSSLTYMAFSLSRFNLVGETNSRFFRAYHRQTLGTFLLVCVTFSCLLSGYTLFQYRLNTLHAPRNSFPIQIHEQSWCEYWRQHPTACHFFTTLRLVDTVVRGIVLFALNLLIDISLFVVYRGEIKQKKRLASVRTDELDKKRNKLARMIIISGVCYFVSHFPEFLTTVYLTAYAKKISKFCLYTFSCEIVAENAQFFCLVSMCAQFFILRRFNTNFLASWREMKSDVAKKVGGINSSHESR